MKLGLLAGDLQDASGLGRFAAEVEAAGFDSLWMGDHVSFPAPILDPFQVLTAYAAHTRTIELGTCVYLLPLRPPGPVAKMVASLDFLCGGRLIFGIGVGGEFPREFEVCGVPVAERGGRTNEAIEIVRRLWLGETGVHRGKYFELSLARLSPGPARPGGPPIWVGGRAESALRRTARHADGYVGYMLDPDGFAQRLGRIRELAAEAPEATRTITGALLCFAFVDDDREAAVARAAGMLGAMYGRPMQAAAERYALVGSLTECQDRVARYREAGVEHLIVSPLAHGDELRPQLERLRELRT